MSVENIDAFLKIVIQLGLLGVVMNLISKAADWLGAKAQEGLTVAQAKTNEISFFSKTKVDDLMWETVKKLSHITFKTVKEALKQDLADGKIDKEVYRQRLHEDLKRNFELVVSEDKKALFKQAYGDVAAVLDKLIPGVVAEAKQETQSLGNS